MTAQASLRKTKRRCAWAGTGLMADYHDRVWGVPISDDRLLFEFLILEGAQAGLSWSTILNRREGYRAAFSGFDVRKVARYDKRKIARLLEDSRIIRNRLKVESAVANARAFINVQREFGAFARYIWSFVDGRPIQNRPRTDKEIPAKTEISEALSKDLRERGFRFVGPTICYAHMQATGMVNDHTVDCFRRREVEKLGRKFRIG